MEASASKRDVRDVYGRHYRVGERAEELTGHPRRSLLWAAWLCMVAISPLQYAFGVAALGLRSSNAWGTSQTLWMLALFVACQAGVAVPAAWLHRGQTVSPSRLVVAGGVLSALGLLTLAHADQFLAAVVGYAVVGGVGAGLVYSTCLNTAAKWFPDKRVTTIGFVTGGFACGALPTIVALTVFSTDRGQSVVFDVAALVALVAISGAGLLLKDPPPHWWPEEIDAQSWAIDHQLNRSLPHNVPAVRSYAPGEALRTGMLPLMWLIMALITAVSLFGIGFIALYAVDAGLGGAVAGLAAGLLAAVNGFGRTLAGRLSDQLGRRRALSCVLVVEGIALLGIVLAGSSGNPWAYATCATFAGLGAGAFYAIFANLVLEFFGENSVLQNQAIVYTAKAVGGLVGVGGGAMLVTASGYAPVFTAAGLLGLGTAVMVRFLRQPGYPSLPVRPQLGTPVVAGADPVHTSRRNG